MGEVSGVRSDPDELFLRAQAGDEDAWDELLTHCYDKVRRVVRRKLRPRMRSVYDSSDITQDVLKSLVAKADRFAFGSIDELQAYMFNAAKQKVIDTDRFQHRQKRDLARQQHLGALADEDARAFDPPSDDPTPSQFAQESETREALYELGDESTRRIFDLKSQHYSNEEAAVETGLGVRTVQRYLKKTFDLWARKQEPRP